MRFERGIGLKRASLACVLGALAVPSMADQFVNGSFEDPSAFNGWTTQGVAQIQGSSIGVNPTDGVQQALLMTYSDGSYTGVPAGSGASESTLETGLGLSSGSLGTFSGSTVLAGSGVAQSVFVQAGWKVKFNWDFMTNQTYNDGSPASIAPSANNNDFSFFSVSMGGSAQILKLADTFYGYHSNNGAPGGFNTGFVLTATANPFISETTYQSFTWTAPTSGVYQFGAGVAHVTANGAADNGVNSGLMLDNFTVVPEPTSMVAFGVMGLGFLRRRGRR